MNLRKIGIIGLIIVSLILIGVLVSYYFFGDSLNFGDETFANGGFNLDKSFVKIILNENETFGEMLTITNEQTSRHFTVKSKNIDLEIKDNEFDLDIYEKKTIDILFDSKDHSPGVYLDVLEVGFNGETEKIPLIIELQTRNVYFDSNINLFPGGEFVPGQRLTAELKLFDLGGLGRSNIKLSYFLSDFSGKVIASEFEEIILDSKSTLTKIVNLPGDLEFGDYIFYVILEYEDSIGTSSSLFKITEEIATSISDSGKKSSDVDSLLMIIIIIFGFFFLIFLIFLGLFIYSLFFRDKMLRDIDRQYERELGKQKEQMDDYGKKISSRLKTPEEREVYKRELDKIKKLRLEALRETKDKKIKEFKTIKKRFKGDKKRRQLQAWKRRGYDTRELEKKYKLPKVK